MIKIGVMSDTHGHIDLMNEVAHAMAELGAQMIFHLGDDLADARHLTVGGPKIVAVPGIFESSYKNPAIQNRILEVAGGIRFLLSHTPTKDGHDLPGDVDPEAALQEGAADVLLHGHTHDFCIEKLGRGFKINPGHLNPPDKKGRPETFAILEANFPTLKVQIIGTNAKVHLEKTLMLGS